MDDWRAVIGFESKYRVRDTGEVRNILTGKRVTVNTLPNGYGTIGFYVNGKVIRRLHHRVVAEAFLGPRPNGLQINHKDGNKVNNHASNLEYMTRSQNMRHGMAMGLISAGAAQRRLTDEQVDEIRRLRPTHSVVQLAERFGVCKQHISHVCNGCRRKVQRVGATVVAN